MKKSSSASAPSSSSVPSATSKRMRSNAAGARTDVAWEYGIEVGYRRVKCKFCNEDFTSGMFRFKHHLARTHQNVSACTNVPEDVKVKIQNILEQNELASKKRKGMLTIDEVEQPRQRGKVHQNTLNKIFKKDEREKVCQQIARFFYTSALSFNCVKNPKFRKMVQMIGEYGRGLDPPSYHELRVTFLKKEVDYTKSLVEEYKNEWKKTGCTLMSDGWSDRKNRSIYNFLVNSPRGTIFLASIDTSEISKTKEKVFAMLDDFVEKIGEEHVVQVVTDNAANYKAAGAMLMDKRKKLFWTPCAAHCIDLMLEDFEKKLEEHKVTIAKGRKVVSFIYNRTRLICLLREYTNGRELLRPGVTRFATSYLTLIRLHELKGALISMFASEKWGNSNFAKSEVGKNIESIILDNVGFWRSVYTCCVAAAPLIRVLRMVDSESPAMGYIFDAMVKAKIEIKNIYKNVKARYQPVLDIIDERWETQLQRPLHVAGYYLNPQMQYSPDFGKEDYGFSKKIFYECLEKMCGDENLSKTVDLQLDLFKNSKGLFNCRTAKLTRNDKSPADWWDSFGHDTPELKQFAIRVLSLTCSSSGCERNWSAFEMVHSKRRNRLQQQKMNDLVYVMYNLKLSGREERKRKEDDFGVEQPETETFKDVDSDDEWITEDNEDLTNMYVNESTTDGASGDDDFLEHAIRNQYGGNEQSREESSYVSEERNEVEAVEQLQVID